MRLLIIILLVLPTILLSADYSYFSVTSNYMSRGISYGEPAIQGGIGYLFDTKCFVEGWTSNSSDTQEFDGIVGCPIVSWNDLNITSSLIWYNYQKLTRYNYFETNLTIETAVVKGAVFVAPAVKTDDSTRRETYLELSKLVPINAGLKLAALVGNHSYSDGSKSWQNGQIGVVKSYSSNVDVGMYYSTTNREFDDRAIFIKVDFKY